MISVNFPPPLLLEAAKSYLLRKQLAQPGPQTQTKSQHYPLTTPGPPGPQTNTRRQKSCPKWRNPKNPKVYQIPKTVCLKSDRQALPLNSRFNSKVQNLRQLPGLGGLNLETQRHNVNVHFKKHGEKLATCFAKHCKSWCVIALIGRVCKMFALCEEAGL